MATPTSADRRPLRADAERNRRLILDSARELFACKGLHVGLDEIARHAGVGVGTVYRRFPDKEALIGELFDDRIQTLVSRLDDAATISDDWEAFRAFVATFAQMQAEDRGLKELMFKGDQVGRKDVARDQIKPRVGAMIARAQAAGVVRADLATPDMALVNIMLGTLADAARDTDPEVWKRALTIVLDGLVVARDGVTPLPGEPLDPDQIDATMRASVARR
jgi:AcrR family transcriptional regulator